MKNIIIIVLVLALGVVGYFQFVRNGSPDTDSTGNTTNSASSESTSVPTAAASDKNSLNLANSGLTEVPKDKLDNSKVTTLDVSGNNLTGALPAEIRKLTNLEVLTAADNNMTGIPAEIGQLSKLKTANFANNNISGLPLEIGNLKNLETLDLRGNPNVSAYDISQIQPKIPNAQILTD